MRVLFVVAVLAPHSSQLDCVFKGCEGCEEMADDPSAEYNIKCRNLSGQFPMRDYTKSYVNVEDSIAITTFEITHEQIRQIPQGVFDKLAVELVDLSHNQIERIDKSTFEGAAKIDILDLNMNAIRHIDQFAFLPLADSISQLKMASNHLGAMGDDLAYALNPLINLNVLTLDQNELMQLPDLTGLVDLVELSLNQNLLTSLYADQVLFPEKLVDLQLKQNKISHIDERAFANLKHLKHLNLEMNLLSYLSPNAFKHLVNLQTLDLNKNNFNHVPSAAIFPLGNLKRLYFAGQNQILKAIENYAFDRMPGSALLEKIDLSKNNIATISDKAFCSLSEQYPQVAIEEIDLGENKLTTLNACVVRQLAKGLKQSPLNVNHKKARLIFKAYKEFNSQMDEYLTCDCEVTKSASLVDFEGECKSKEGSYVSLSKYPCGMLLSIKNVAVQVEAECAKLPRYECERDDASPEVDEAANSNSQKTAQPRVSIETHLNTHATNVNKESVNEDAIGGRHSSSSGRVNKVNQATKQPSAIEAGSAATSIGLARSLLYLTVSSLTLLLVNRL